MHCDKGLNVSAKSINPTSSAQADLGQSILLVVSFLQLMGPFYLVILSFVRQMGFMDPYESDELQDIIDHRNALNQLLLESSSYFMSYPEKFHFVHSSMKNLLVSVSTVELSIGTFCHTCNKFEPNNILPNNQSNNKDRF